MCFGPGHLVRHGNPAFLAMFGATCVGLPAREGLVTLPPEAFHLLDVVLERGRPYARWIRMDGAEWRMTAVPRVDIGTGETYGVAFSLRSREEQPTKSEETAQEAEAD